ncbi:MAG: serine/threonine protein kinase [Verrucomicrobia bacterium]|nr:serine/threonine protein kinase [Verrucomicrobiota bacterium]
MKTLRTFRLAVACLLAAGSASLADNWPMWRGPNHDGVSPEKDIPTHWTSTENVRWKTPLPEGGDSSPIVWGGKVFITQSIEAEGGRNLMSFDTRTGKLLWKQGTTWKQSEQRYGKNPYCAASPATDGERVIAFFGSAGLFCWDMDGRELWRRDLGRHHYEWGYASSPILHGDLCVLYFGPGDKAALLALDKKTGKTVWQADEPAITRGPRTDGFRGSENRGMVCTYSTPIIMKAGARDELVMPWPQQARAYDPKSGRELWRCEGLNELVYCSPVAGDGVVVAMGGFFGTTIAVRGGGSGDVTAANRLWQTVRTKNRLGTGIVRGQHVYVLNTELGLAECLELTTGKVAWSENIQAKSAKRDSWSSMVLAGDHLYSPTQGGEVVVLRADPKKFEQVAINPLDNELINSSPAVSHGRIFIRTHKNLWCIGAGN